MFGVCPYMTLRLRWARLSQLACLAVLALFAGFAVFVHIQQFILRWRAERLLSDIGEIQMGKSTWADAQRMMTRWGAWGAYDGTCSAERCQYQIVLQDAYSAEPIRFWSTGHTRPSPQMCCRWFRRPFRALGGRQAIVYAGLNVKNGIVWTKAYDVATALGPRHFEGDEEWGEELVGSADGLTRFWENVPWFSVGVSEDSTDRHPEYKAEIAPICSECLAIDANFTPFADPDIVRQLLDFNLDCITRWFECKVPAEIMPGAVRLYEQDKAVPPRSGKSWDKCELPLEVLGRDYKFVAIAEVTDTRIKHGSDGYYQWFRFRPIVSLKNRAVPQEPVDGKDEHSEPLEAHLAGGGLAADLKPGSRFILLFESALNDHDAVTIGAGKCGFVSYSEQNLAVIKRGIHRDALSDPQ